MARTRCVELLAHKLHAWYGWVVFRVLWLKSRNRYCMLQPVQAHVSAWGGQYSELWYYGCDWSNKSMFICASVGVHLITPSFFIHTYTLFGVRNSRTCASDSACSQHILRCPSMCLHGRACATSWIRVLCACSTLRVKQMRFYMCLSPVCRCVLWTCCCNVSVAKYIVHLALPLETSIGNLLIRYG